MTERERLLEAVADVVRANAPRMREERAVWEKWGYDVTAPGYVIAGQMLAALDALDAHQPQPAAGETVEVWGFVRTDPVGYVDGRVGTNEIDIRGRAIEWGRTENGPMMGTVFRIRVPLPTVPTIDAEVLS